MKKYIVEKKDYSMRYEYDDMKHQLSEYKRLTMQEGKDECGKCEGWIMYCIYS